MGDLFDGYGSTLAPRKTPSGIPAFDEMFRAPAHPGAAAESRAAYRELYQALVAKHVGTPETAAVDDAKFATQQLAQSADGRWSSDMVPSRFSASKNSCAS